MLTQIIRLCFTYSRPAIFAFARISISACTLMLIWVGADYPVRFQRTSPSAVLPSWCHVHLPGACSGCWVRPHQVSSRGVFLTEPRREGGRQRPSVAGERWNEACRVQCAPRDVWYHSSLRNSSSSPHLSVVRQGGLNAVSLAGWSFLRLRPKLITSSSVAHVDSDSPTSLRGAVVLHPVPLQHDVIRPFTAATYMTKFLRLLPLPAPSTTTALLCCKRHPNASLDGGRL